MATYAGEPSVNAHAQAKTIDIPLKFTCASGTGAVALDTARADPDLVNKVEIVGSAIAGTLLTEQTFTGADISNVTTAVFGVGLLDGLAQRVSGHGEIHLNTGTGNAGTAVPLPILTIAGITGQTFPGVTSKGNVAVLVTIAGGAANTLAAATGTGYGWLRLTVK